MLLTNVQFSLPREHFLPGCHHSELTGKIQTQTGYLRGGGGGGGVVTRLMTGYTPVSKKVLKLCVFSEICVIDVFPLKKKKKKKKKNVFYMHLRGITQ